MIFAGKVLLTKTMHPLLSRYKMGEGEGGRLFKSQQIGRRLLERDAYSRGRIFEEGALFLGFTVYI